MGSDAMKLGNTSVFTVEQVHNNYSNFDNDAVGIVTLQLSAHSLNCV